MKNVIVALIVSLLAVACAPEKRYVFTDADIAAREAAKAAGQTSWVDTEQKTHALTCTQDLGPPFYVCIAWDRDAPSGTFDCTGDMTAYNNEILGIDGAQTNCFGIDQTWSTQVSALGDYNDVVAYMKNNSSNSVNVYEHGSFGGSMLQTIWVGGNTLQAITTSNNANQKVSSFRRN